MEGVGARFGRFSTRYGPATVFNGPVRKWKKKWVHVSSSSSSSSTSAAASNSHSTSSHPQNGIANGNNGSHLVLFKWTPITQSQNNHNNNNADKKQDNNPPPDEPPRRKFKYIPIAVLEEQKNETESEGNENIEDNNKLSDADQSPAEHVAKCEVLDEKLDINDVPMEENQGNNQVMRQDLNESTLDLSLGFTSCDDEHSKTNKKRDGQLPPNQSRGRL